MEDIKPDRKQRRNDVRPIEAGTNVRIFDGEEVKPHQGQSGEEQRQADREEQVTDSHGPPIRTVVRILDVRNPEHDKGQDQDETQDEMAQEHELIEVILVADFLVQPLQEGDARKVKGICAKQGGQPKDKIEQ